MFTKDSQDKWGWKSSRFATGEAAHRGKEEQQANVGRGGGSRPGLWRVTEQPGTAGGCLRRQTGGFCRSLGRKRSGRERDRGKERHKSGRDQGRERRHSRRPRGFPSVKALPGKRRCRSRSLLQ